MLVPEASEKTFSRVLKREASWIEGYPKSILSSINCWWEIVGRLWMDKPLSRLERRACLMWRPRPSAINTKRKGERGSPRLIPLEGLNGREGIPLMRMEKKEEDMSLITQHTHICEKPKADSIFRTYNQLSLSKAFERSSLRIILSCLECLRECTISWERMIPSRICRPST